jgi:hypothetical protein
MDDRRRRAVTPPRFNSVVASATVMAARPTSLRKANPAQAWWEDAWAFYDSNGELRFAVGWIANGLSRLNLLAARRPPLLGDDPAPLAGTSDIEKAANALVSDIAGGPDGQSQMLARLATLLTVTGLGWVLIESTSRGGVDGTWSWRVLSNDELRADRGEYEVEDVESPDVSPEGWRKLHRNHVLIKIWRSHARRSSQPDSSCRGALRPLRQLALLDDHIEATAQSRLAGAGLLILPNEVEFSPIAREADPDDPDADGASTDDFTEVMIDTMTTPIYDRGIAAADVVCDDVAELHTHLDVSSFASVNQLLEDVWGRVPAIAERYGVDPDVLLAAVDAYTRGLLVNGEKHTIDRLADALPLGAVAA